jgi:hypothetical protein
MQVVEGNGGAETEQLGGYQRDADAMLVLKDSV